MAQTVLTVDALPGSALDAVAAFSADWLPAIRDQLGQGDCLTIVLPGAAYDHADWRRAAVRDLARHYAPVRINFITAAEPAAVDAVVAYLAGANGVTGQYLPLHHGSSGSRDG